MRAEPVWDPQQHPGAWRAIWSYSATRARRDQKTLAAQEKRARAIVDGERPAKSARFVKVKGSDRHLDETSLARAQSLVGLKGYVSNVPITVMAATEVIAKYHDLWKVENSFRMSKSDLAARPIFHRQRRSIEAHLTIVFTALAISHAIQSRTGLSIAQVVKQLRTLRSATITINGTTHSHRSTRYSRQSRVENGALTTVLTQVISARRLTETLDKLTGKPMPWNGKALRA